MGKLLDQGYINGVGENNMKELDVIEGYSGYVPGEFDIPDDTNPGSCIVTFSVKSEEMPAKSAQAGKRIFENFVWITKQFDLGRSEVSRRINDKVHYDSELGKWVVDELVEYQSDIKAYPQHWNAFARGSTQGAVGTPINLLFKNNPAKVENYTRYKVDTIEMLSQLGDDHLRQITIGGIEDRERAKKYLADVAKMAPSLQLNQAMAEKDEQIDSLRSQVSELSSKINALIAGIESKAITQEVERPAKRGRPAKEQSEESVSL